MGEKLEAEKKKLKEMEADGLSTSTREAFKTRSKTNFSFPP